MVRHALELLERVLRLNGAKDDRLTDLLLPPDREGDHGWFVHVPRCFNDPLDIRLTERVLNGENKLTWTQGSWFAFKVGDTFYDTAQVRAEELWADSMQHLRFCITVLRAGDARPRDGESERSPGYVELEVHKPDAERKRLVLVGTFSMTQDQFVRLLITGEGAEW